MPREDLNASKLLAARAELTSGPDASLLINPLGTNVPPMQRSGVYAAHARVLFLLGDETGARRALAAWAEALPRSSPFPWQSIALGTVGESLPALGEIELIEELYTVVAAQTWIRVGNAFTGGMDRILGDLALRLGHLEAAEQHYQTGLAWAERERCPIEQARCLQGLAELALHRDQREQAPQYFDRAAALYEHYGATFYLQRLLAARAAAGV